MFRLLRYFSIASAVSISVATLVLVYMYRTNATHELVHQAESENLALTQAFANTVWPRFSKYVTTVTESDGDTLRARPETADIHRALKMLATGLPVLKIKIYNLQGTTIYSSEARQIGEDKSENLGFDKAARLGLPASKLSYRGTFSSFSGAVSNRSLVESYIPVRGIKGEAGGVFELYTDVTPLIERIKSTTIKLTLWLLMVFTSLYGILFLIVHRADKILKMQYADLHREIDEHQKTEEKFYQAKLDAEEANLAKSKFLSSMSHELRTPLNAVLGFTQLLDNPKNPLNDEQLRAVKDILDSGKHLLNLINEVLDLSKIESGHLDMTIVPVTCGCIVDPCMVIADSMSLKYDVTVENRISNAGLPMVMADQTRFKQVLLNLLSNAVKYNRPGGSVILDCRETENNTLRFSVTDAGLGIPEEKLSQLFTPFNRLNNENSTVEGTGIGLTITKELVEKMDGRIGFESTYGKGSIFWFELPIAEGIVDEPKDGPYAPTRSSIATATVATDETKSILYIEDNAANIRLMTMIIERNPHLILKTAITAELGLESVANEKPDLILMDIQLPGMNGIEALGILKKNPSTADIPVIAVSAMALVNDFGEVKENGFVDYISKPFMIPDVLEAIVKTLNK